MKQIKLIDVVNAVEPLKKLANAQTDNFSALRAVSKLVKKSEEELTFYREEANKISEKHILKDENGNFIKDSENPNMVRVDSEYGKLMQELANTELTDFEEIEIKITDFKDFTLSANELDILDKLVNIVD